MYQLIEPPPSSVCGGWLCPQPLHDEVSRRGISTLGIYKCAEPGEHRGQDDHTIPGQGEPNHSGQMETRFGRSGTIDVMRQQVHGARPSWRDQ
jgi:hypothetical protein